MFGIAIIGYALSIIGAFVVQAQEDRAGAALAAACKSGKRDPFRDEDWEGDEECRSCGGDADERHRTIIKRIRSEERRVAALKKKEMPMSKRMQIARLLGPFVMIVGGGALAFGLIEGWTWSQSLYFCIIT